MQRERHIRVDGYKDSQLTIQILNNNNRTLSQVCRVWNHNLVLILERMFQSSSANGVPHNQTVTAQTRCTAALVADELTNRVA